MTDNSTEILQKMVEADGYIQVVRGPTDEYITVCRPNGTALFEGVLPPRNTSRLQSGLVCEAGWTRERARRHDI
jgi:hypothetical protein